MDLVSKLLLLDLTMFSFELTVITTYGFQCVVLLDYAGWNCLPGCLPSYMCWLAGGNAAIKF